MSIKFTILLLQINTSIAIITKNKVETMFRFYFIFLFIILINNLNKFSYLIFIKDNKIMSKCEVIKAMHKIICNNILEINDIINCTLRQLIYIVLS